jgi:hypothetical protein
MRDPYYHDAVNVDAIIDFHSKVGYESMIGTVNIVIRDSTGGKTT